MQISNKGINLIANFEGFSSCPYWDSYGSVWTRGYGEAGGRISGNSPCITRQQGQENLRSLVNNDYGRAVNDLGVTLNQNQFDALCSFTYNLGAGSMQWNVGRSLREKKYNQAAEEMLQYDRAGGVILAGLVTRRRAEVNLFRTPAGPPPPPPNPLNVFYPAERRVVNSYLSYMKHPNWHKHGLLVCYNRMVEFRKNIYDAAVYGGLRSGRRVQKGWDINHRYNRYEILKKYTY
jgi:lysozyme